MTNAPTSNLAVRPERVPPQDLDAEMALLGAMMTDRDAVTDVLPIMSRTDSRWFYLPAHQKLFEALLDLYDNPAKAIDLVVVSDELRRRDLFDFIGGHAYMVRLAESYGDWTRAEHYARVVRDKGMLRDLIRCVGEIGDHAFAGVEEAKDILEQAEQRIFEVTERRISGETVAIRDVVDHIAEQMEKGGAVCTGLPSGFFRLDELTSGFQPGDFIVLAGRPSMGKTALGLTMCYNAAVRPPRGFSAQPIVFFSLEMSKEQVAQRLICMHTEIDAQKLRQRLLGDEEMNRLLYAREDFKNAPLYVDDTPGMTVMELRAKARRLKQKHDISAVFVDYLQLMHCPGSESRQAEIATISRQLKALGRELKIPIIAMAQLNRMAEGRPDKKPIMSDLRESGAIEQDADVVLLIHREEYYHPDRDEFKGLADLIIAKQRNGPVDTVQLMFNKRLTLFRPYSGDPAPHRVAAEPVPF